MTESTTPHAVAAMSELAARPRANSLSQIQADAWSRRDARISEINAQWTARLEGATKPPPTKAVEWPAEWPSRRAPPAAVEPVTNAGGSLPPSTSVETILNGRAAGLSDYCATVVKKAGADFAGPMYVVDLGAAERLLEAWRIAFPRIEPRYAVKCFPDSQLIKALSDQGCGFDCASEKEARLALDAGCPPSRIVFANPCKLPADVAFLHASGISLTTFDSIDELDKLRATDCRVLLRIRADDSASRLPFGAKYGCLEGEIAGLIEACADRNIRLCGVAFHVGSGARSPKAFADAVCAAKRVFDLYTTLRPHATPLDVLDVGGGFCGGFSDDGNAAVSASGDCTVVDALNQALTKYFPLAQYPSLQIIAEPGRYFAEASAALCCRVVGSRSRELVSNNNRREERQCWISDGVYGAFNAIVYDGWLPHAVVVGGGGVDGSDALTTVFGPTCDSLDVVFSRVADAPSIRRGDWLLFPCCGAYTSAGACDFNGLPATAYAGVRTRYVRSASLASTEADAALPVIYSDRPPMEVRRYF